MTEVKIVQDSLEIEVIKRHFKFLKRQSSSHFNWFILETLLACC